MNETFTELNKVIGYYLNKLKFRNPTIFILVQCAIWGLLWAFTMDKININTDVDTIIIAILAGLVSGISPRTTSLSEEYKKDIKSIKSNKSNKSDKSVKSTEDILELPDIDQSNN